MDPVFERKAVAYTDAKGVNYLISGIFFDDLLVPTSANNTYINVFRYVTEPKDLKYPNGYFTINQPIDAFSLKM